MSFTSKPSETSTKIATEIQRLWRGYKARRGHITPCRLCKKYLSIYKHKEDFWSSTHCSDCKKYVAKAESDYRKWLKDPYGALDPPNDIHYCGDFYCEGDCGVLSCGCIDVCRRHAPYRDRW